VAEKNCTSSVLYKGVMNVRRPAAAQRPPLVIELGLKESMPGKLVEELKAKGVDPAGQSARDAAKESGTAAMTVTLKAVEGVGDDAKDLLDEKWEAEVPVGGASAEARTDTELDAAYKKAGEKACGETLNMAIDSLALSLIAREGALAQGLMPLVKARCSDPNEVLSKKAQETYAQMVQGVHARALESVKSAEKDARLNGLKDLLNENPPGDDVLEVVVGLLQDPEYNVRSVAALALVTRKLDTEGLAKVLCEVLNDRSASMWGGARDGLLKIGTSCAPLLLEALAGNNRNAYMILETFAAKDTQVVGELGKLLTGDNEDLKKKSLAILLKVGPAAAPTVPALIEILSGADPALRGSAATVLGRVGADAESALPAIEKAIQDGVREARSARSSILDAMRKAGKTPPVAETKPVTKDASGKTVVLPPPPTKMVKRKTLVFNDGKEVVVESFMKIGEEYRVKTPDGESATYSSADIKEVKVEEVKEEVKDEVKKDVKK
jgi:HEAT repeat protein